MLKLPLFGAAGGPFILNLLGVPAGAAFGVRKLNGSYTGAALNVRRSSDNATLDIGFLPNGSFNASAFSGFIGAGSGFVTKWYDQSGNGRDASQSTAASQPQLVLSTIGTRPTLKFSGAQSLILPSFGVSTSPQSIVAMAERTGAFTSFNGILATSGNNRTYFVNAAGEAALASTGNVVASASDSAAHSLLFIFNGASSLVTVDGTDTTGTDGADSVATDTAAIGAFGASATLPLTGYISEVWTALGIAYSSSQRSLIHANQSAYYGTS